MLNITINGQPHQVADGTRVIDACRAADVEIPTLCWLEGQAHFTSCMVCVVKDVRLGRLIPACSAPVTDGMAIETGTDEVRDARRVALELLLSEHVGDCRAPCQRVCPAQIDIPRMIRQIASGDLAAAAQTVQQAQAQTGVTCESCKAPCEKACRRGRVDQTVAIRRLVGMLGKVETGTRQKTEDRRLITDDINLQPAICNAQQPGTKYQEPRTFPRFDSTIGPLQPGDMEAFLAGASAGEQVVPIDGDYTPAEAAREAARCLRCDCRKPENCKLRDLAESYGARQSRYKGTGRNPVAIMRDHPAIVFEPGKCIKCGICTRLAEAAGEVPGLTFQNRGMETTIGVPFGDPLGQALTQATALRCADACPTGALARPEGETEDTVKK
jgi:predicted molibdopterin-dependent oxidoreductase YjgC